MGYESDEMAPAPSGRSRVQPLQSGLCDVLVADRLKEQIMWRYLGVLALVFAVAVLGFSLVDGGDEAVGAQTVLTAPQEDIGAYAQAVDTWDWQFPRDHGAHPRFQTEWWYYTGNLSAADGRRFGFQFTIFRRAVAPTLTASDSEWRTGQVYMAHFTLSDITGQQFFHDERYSRGGAGLAGAEPVYGDPALEERPYRVWLEDWQVMAVDDDAQTFAMQAAMRYDGQPVAIDLTLEAVKPIAFQGQAGLSPKSAVEGNASYYYSMTRLETHGTVQVGQERLQVSGRTWMDHEFSTSALGEGAQGWDWFGLILDDGREMMLGQIRLDDGGREPAFGGLIVHQDGSTTYLPSETFSISGTDSWTSPHTGAVYPSGWQIVIDGAALGQPQDLELMVTPLMQDQELHSGDIAYWEGAVSVAGSDAHGALSGVGYAELTGYVGTMEGRF